MYRYATSKGDAQQQPPPVWLAGWLTLTAPSVPDAPLAAPAASGCESMSRALMSLRHRVSSLPTHGKGSARVATGRTLRV